MMIHVKRIGLHTLPLPARGSEQAGGYDLRTTTPMRLHPGERAVLPTGFSWRIPRGWVGQVWPRSGRAKDGGLDRMAGLIDSDYRGELGAMVINHGHETLVFAPGDRVAQLVIVPCAQADLLEVETLDDTQRGDGGYGHTGSR